MSVRHDWKIVETDLHGTGWTGGKPPKAVGQLEALEADGWEILNVTGQSNTGIARIIAKRPKGDDTHV
jgi:hypothetical protein